MVKMNHGARIQTQHIVNVSLPIYKVAGQGERGKEKVMLKFMHEDIRGEGTYGGTNRYPSITREPEKGWDTRIYYSAARGLQRSEILHKNKWRCSAARGLQQRSVSSIFLRVSYPFTALACGAVNGSLTERKFYIASYETFLFHTGFLENRDSKWKIEENNFYLSRNFLSNGYNFLHSVDM